LTPTRPGTHSASIASRISITIRLRFSALPPGSEAKAADAFQKKLSDREISKLSWSGDRLFVRSKKKIGNQEAVPVFPDDTLETLHERIKEVERRIYPEVLRALIAGTDRPGGA